MMMMMIKSNLKCSMKRDLLCVSYSSKMNEEASFKSKSVQILSKMKFLFTCVNI